eukprot:1890224-Pleurochrysis_carterae.AAC.6
MSLSAKRDRSFPRRSVASEPPLLTHMPTRRGHCVVYGTSTSREYGPCPNLLRSAHQREITPSM